MSKWVASIFLTHAGKTLSAREWSKVTGLKYATILLRKELGWSDEECLTTPLRVKYTGSEQCSFDPTCKRKVRFKGLCAAHYARKIRDNDPEHQKKMKEYRRTHPAKYKRSFCGSLKLRAKRLGVPFDLKPEDIVIPERCPILGIPLIRAKGYLCNNSITVDKIIPELGYVRGNIQIISCRANKLKCNMTLAEMRKLYEATKQAILENGLQAYAGFDMTAL